jgi:hypothetical protein
VNTFVCLSGIIFGETYLFSGPNKNSDLVRMMGTFFFSLRTFDFLPFNARVNASPSERRRAAPGRQQGMKMNI